MNINNAPIGAEILKQVPKMMDDYDKLIATLSKLVTSLEERLEPVLLQKLEAKVEEIDRYPLDNTYVPLAIVIDENNNKLRDVIDEIQSILKRLEL